ncbi:MAG: hypothetical protein HC764_19805 [Pleurocapsa sp. CRU_1_2]|nr:hypothetical protein [Pleurocapsa sp. CRU_1_2]
MNSSFNSRETELNYLPQPALDRIANRGIFDTQCEGHQILDKIANKWTILIIKVSLTIYRGLLGICITHALV